MRRVAVSVCALMLTGLRIGIASGMEQSVLCSTLQVSQLCWWKCHYVVTDKVLEWPF